MSRHDRPNFCFKEMALNAVQGMDGGARVDAETPGIVQVRETGGWGSQWWELGKGTDGQNQGELWRLKGRGCGEKGRRRGQD